MAHLCVTCQQLVRPRQEGILCELCYRWQHRTCGSGISREDYRKAVREGGEIDWTCADCVDGVPYEEESSGGELYADDLGPYNKLAQDWLDESDDAISLDDIDFNPSPAPVSPVPSETDSQEKEKWSDDFPIRYMVVKNGSIRKRDILVDSLGYQYSKRGGTSRTWRCSIRNKTLVCKATVKEEQGSYTRGTQQHVCKARPGRERGAIMSREVKKRALRDIWGLWEPTAKIVREVYLEYTTPQEFAAIYKIPVSEAVIEQENHKQQMNRLPDNTAPKNSLTDARR